MSAPPRETMVGTVGLLHERLGEACVEHVRCATFHRPLIAVKLRNPETFPDFPPWAPLASWPQRTHALGMEATEIFRGRLVDHIHLVVRDLAASKRFYQAVLGVLEISSQEGPDFFYADELFVSTATSRAAAGRTTGPTHLAFQARDRATVDRFHAAAVAAGGKDNGAPGERPYHPGYYAAYVVDPDGNNVEVVHHGPAKRSTDAVHITF